MDDKEQLKKCAKHYEYQRAESITSPVPLHVALTKTNSYNDGRRM